MKPLKLTITSCIFNPLKSYSSVIVFSFLSLLSMSIFADEFKSFKSEFGNKKSLEEQINILTEYQSSVPLFSATQQAEYWLLFALKYQESGQYKASYDQASKVVNSYEKDRLNNTEQLIDAYFIRSGSLYRFQDSPTQYCADAEKALELTQIIENRVALSANLYSIVATCEYDKTGDITKALYLTEQAIDIAQTHELNEEIKAGIYNETAMMYRKLGLYAQAYQHNENARQLWEKSGDFQGVYNMLKNLTVISTDMGNFKLADKHLEELRLFGEQHTTYKDLPFYYHYHAAVLALRQAQWLKASEHFQQALIHQKFVYSSAYIRATYEQLALSLFANNEISASFNVLTQLETQFSSNSFIKQEVTPIVKLKNDDIHGAVLFGLTLLTKERQAKTDFIQKSIALAADANERNLKQMDNLLLKQRLNYAMVIACLIALLLAALMIIQRQKRLKLDDEKQQAEYLLNAKNQLLADVSHELKTPLTVLKLQVESLRDDLEDDVKLSYQSIDNKLNDIDVIIDDLHLLAKSDIGNLQLNKRQVDFCALFESWIDDFNFMFKKIDFDFEIKNNLPLEIYTEIDGDKMKQIIINLLQNMIKYTDQPGIGKLSIFTSNETINIVIEDSAPSIPEHLQDKIFERLYRVENSRRSITAGSGLGLSICKSLVEAHQGTIFAEKSSLGGLAIKIKLPLIK